MNRNKIYPCKFDEVLKKKVFFFIIVLFLIYFNYLNRRMNKNEEMIDELNAKIIR